MTFTDDDLKRLKEKGCGCKPDWCDSDTGHDLRACIDDSKCQTKLLLARLEAAERVCELVALEDDKRLEMNEGYFSEAIKAWRKAAGK